MLASKLVSKLVVACEKKKGWNKFQSNFIAYLKAGKQDEERSLAGRYKYIYVILIHDNSVQKINFKVIVNDKNKSETFHYFVSKLSNFESCQLKVGEKNLHNFSLFKIRIINKGVN